MKVIAFYLPQFHEIPENNEWWGEGFTEWVNVKKAVQLDDKQYQPRIPLNENYYDLSDVNVLKWQASLARKYGIYGFCMYHYWFNGKKLLEKPIEIFLRSKEIELPFCLCWANENWTNQWVSGTSQKILIEQKYGDKEEWRRHFDYLLPFFYDKRYIKEDNCPLLVIYRPDLIICLDDMLEQWDLWARESGFSGLCYAYQKADTFSFNYKNGKDHNFKYQIEYQPGACCEWQRSKAKSEMIKWKRSVFKWLGYLLHTQKFSTIVFEGKLTSRDYDKDWLCILNHKPVSEKCIPGAFVDWDNTPRKQERGWFYEGMSVDKFEYYFSKLIIRAKEIYKKDMIFIFAWNEWAEGGYLEPDEKNQFGYLNAVFNALKKTNELPAWEESS